MIQPFVIIFGGNFTLKQIQKIKEVCTPTFQRANQQDNIVELIRLHRPQCWATIGGKQTDFPALFNAPEKERYRWMHYDSVSDFMKSLDLLVNVFVHSVIAIRGLAKEKVSAFTTSYNSKKFIHRPLESLLKQTHQDWEWVIYDDSNGNANWAELEKVKARDPHRIRIFRSDGNSGNIGNVKQIASSLCRGDFILELDHDDALAPEAFEFLVAAAKKYPQCGFFYSDYCFIHEDGRNSEHPDGFALGFGGFRRRWNDDFDKWTNISRTVPVTDITIRYLVGCPNHYRAWRAETFRKIGGWCPDFHVADDYEILVRTFLNTQMCRVSFKSYTQFVNNPGPNENTFNNFTWTRNAEIQKIWRALSRAYNDDIHERLLNLQGYDPYYENWENGAEPLGIAYHQTPEFYPQLNEVFEPRDQDDSNPLVFIVLSYDPNTSLDKGSGESIRNAITAIQAQSYKNVELMIVTSGVSKMIEPLMNELIRKNSDEEQVEFIKEHVSYWNFIAGEKTGKPPTPYYMCVNHALKRICTARFAMLLNDDRTFQLPRDFIQNSVKYMTLRDDVSGLTTDQVQHVIYRTSIHVEAGYLSEDQIDLLEVLRAHADTNIVSYDPVEEEIVELNQPNATDDEDGDEEENEDEEQGNDIDEEYDAYEEEEDEQQDEEQEDEEEPKEPEYLKQD